MELSEQQLNEFRALYKRRFGVDLTLKEAQEEALALLNLMKILNYNDQDLRKDEGKRSAGDPEYD